MTKTQRGIVVVGVLVLGVFLHASYCEWDYEWLEPSEKILGEALAFVNLGPVYLLPDWSVIQEEQVISLGPWERLEVWSYMLLEGESEGIRHWVYIRGQEMQAAKSKAFGGGIVAPVLLCIVAVFLGTLRVPARS